MYVALPRFDITYQSPAESLMADLQAMGIRELFDRDSAELQGIADVPKPFYLTTIVHSARIKVDEKGVEAQSASGAQLGCGAAMPLRYHRGPALPRGAGGVQFAAHRCSLRSSVIRVRQGSDPRKSRGTKAPDEPAEP